MFSGEIHNCEQDHAFGHELNQWVILPSASWKLSADTFGRTMSVSEMACHAIYIQYMHPTGIWKCLFKVHPY